MKPGVEAELLAARYLQQHGLTMVQANFRCRFGEIDLILRDGKTLVFAEVRQRSRSDFGGALASIDHHKQQRIILAAQFYLSSLQQVPTCRFDALLLDASGNIEWIKNAFEA
ncbi:MAG: YraN family protein [Gammaproteobacteria bacterium]|nr:YraN family protein [Gammaproteobacteria bacterium]MBU1775049.1 YraN family protein [Gammaproteobacteria bacterium]